MRDTPIAKYVRAAVQFPVTMEVHAVKADLSPAARGSEYIALATFAYFSDQMKQLKSRVLFPAPRGYYFGPVIKTLMENTLLMEDSIALRTGYNAPEPPPHSSDAPAAWDLVLADIAVRDKAGTAKYGQRLKPLDGRDALVDIYQELLDAVVYVRKALYERDGK